MGVVITCPVCGHTSQHGSYVDRLDPKFQSKVSKCQVPVRVAIPNHPGEAMAVPCGCDGTGPAREIPPPVVLAPPPACFLPGCLEFAEPSSSFCSKEHADVLVALFSDQKPEGVNNGNQDQSSPQGRVHGEGEESRDERPGLREQSSSSGVEGEYRDEETGELREEREGLETLEGLLGPRHAAPSESVTCPVDHLEARMFALKYFVVDPVCPGCGADI